MVAWYVDKGLDQFNKQMRKKYPGIVIGTKGDPSHASRESDHNPEADGSVDAADPMIGKAFTKDDADATFQALIHNRDRRIAFVIWDREIVSSTVQPWKIREYTGTSDPHTGHMHVSVNDKHENDATPWIITPRVPGVVRFTVGMPLVMEGDDDRDFDGYDLISRIQRVAGVKDDGSWGPKTTAALGFDRISEARYRQLFGMSR